MPSRGFQDASNSIFSVARWESKGDGFSRFLFFKLPNRRLPKPAEVRALSHLRHPVIFKDLDIFVKFGPFPEVTVAEAQCLWIIKQGFQGLVPVPDVYGWRVDESDVFIYMELIHGQTLYDRFDNLDSSEKKTPCDQLCHIISTLRQQEQDPAEKYIGM